MKSEYRLVLILVISQLLMIAAVTAVILFPGYSVFHRQKVQQQAWQNYRGFDARQAKNSSSRTGDDIEELSKHCSQDGAVTPIDLHLQEEIARASLGSSRCNIKKTISTFRHWVEKSVNTRDRDVSEIALQKLIRLEIDAADLSLARKNIQLANRLQKAAFEDLKRQATCFDMAPQKIHVERILDLCMRIKGAQGENEESKQLLATAQAMSDPLFAKDWYANHGLKGFEGSYPAEYLVRFFLASHQTTRKKGLEQALDTCQRPGVRQSTKVFVLTAAINEARNHQDKALAAEALDLWMKNCSNAPVRFAPEADLIFALKDVAFTSGSAQIHRIFRTKISECIEKDLLSKPCAQMYFDAYEPDRQAGGIWPPKTTAAAKYRRTELDALIALCRKKGLNSFSLDMARTTTLVVTSELDEAEKHILELIDRKGTNDTGRYEQARLSLLTRYVAESVGGRHTEDAYTRAGKILAKALKNRRWLDESKLPLLQSLYGYYKIGDQKEKAACLNEIMRIYTTGAIDDRARERMNFFILNNLIGESGKIDQANRLFNSIKAKHGADSLTVCLLSSDLLGYRRAYPAYGPEAKKISLEKPFPNDMFQNTPALVQNYFPNNHGKYLLCLQYLAQYEFSRGKFDRAREICAKILSNPHVRRTSCLLPTQDLFNELRGTESNPTDPKITAFRGTIVELTCLSTLYFQNGRPAAQARVNALKDRVVETD